MTKPRIELDADVYDTLEFSSLVFGGIGAGAVYDHSDPSVPETIRAPYCVVGHGIVAADCDTQENPIIVALETVGIDVLVNDRAVSSINERKGVDLSSRVPFTPWRKELGIVRKPS